MTRSVEIPCEHGWVTAQDGDGEPLDYSICGICGVRQRDVIEDAALPYLAPDEPRDREALRKRIAKALYAHWQRDDAFPCEWENCDAFIQTEWLARADAVLAVLAGEQEQAPQTAGLKQQGEETR